MEPHLATLRELFGFPEEIDERPWSSAIVGPTELAGAVTTALARRFPGAAIVGGLQLPAGRADLAALTAEMLVGVALDASEPYEARPKSARGFEGFDLAVAIAAYPKDHHLTAKPPHVWCLRAYTGRDGAVEFSLERPAAPPQPATPASLLGLLRRDDLLRLGTRYGIEAGSLPAVRAGLAAGFTVERARSAVALALSAAPASRPPLYGSTVADALAHELQREHRPAAIVREFAYRGAIADVAVLAPDGLHLYEIKGETDGSARLRLQVPAYEAVAATCTLVTTCNHRSFRAKVPDRWGLIECARRAGTPRFVRLRAPAPNPHRHSAHVAHLLDATELRRLRRRLAPFGVSDDELARAALRALATRLVAAYRRGHRAHIALPCDLEAWPR
ncbi:MAG TPA: sce7726 family protein [Verrucomicrobiae bacterium]|nr:sce7726 family protein [Verrucomicrobiae bacterium]